MQEVLHDDIFGTEDYVIRVEMLADPSGGGIPRYTLRHRAYDVLSASSEVLPDIMALCLQVQRDYDGLITDPENALIEMEGSDREAGGGGFDGGGTGTVN